MLKLLGVRCFKSTTLFDELCQKAIIRPICEIADIRIGIESLAKDFFVISAQEKEDEIVENQYLVPFVYSLHDFDNPIISENYEPVYDPFLLC